MEGLCEEEQLGQHIDSHKDSQADIISGVGLLQCIQSVPMVVFTYVRERTHFCQMRSMMDVIEPSCNAALGFRELV